MKGDLRIATFMILLMALFGQGLVAYGQETGDAALRVRFRRNFGYGMGSQMQGKFTIRVDGPEDLTRVEFLLDEQVIGEDSEAPFSLAFDTGDYAEGIHRFLVVGYRANGEKVQSETISRQFVGSNIVTIVVIAIVALVVIFRVASYLLTRRSGGRKSKYGLLGGAVCPNCGRAFGIHWWSLRLGVGRFDRCSHCGKWHMTRRASAEALQSAEEVFDEEAGSEKATSAADQEEKLKRLLDESRYDQG